LGIKALTLRNSQNLLDSQLFTLKGIPASFYGKSKAPSRIIGKGLKIIKVFFEPLYFYKSR
jgi:hypothetical protein